MIEVSDGYARNFLLPKKLAQEANADNINTMRMNDKATQERQAKRRAGALEISKKMKDMTVVVMARAAAQGALRLRHERGNRRKHWKSRRKLRSTSVDCRRPHQDCRRLHRQCKLGYENHRRSKVEVREL